MSDDEEAPRNIKYLVTTAQGEFVIEIPDGWKVTFGAVNPGGNPQGMHGRDLHCLRVWESKEKLRAVFCDVRGIRDLAIPLARKIERQTGSSEWTRDDLGNFETSARQQIETTIVEDSDAIPFEGNGKW